MLRCDRVDWWDHDSFVGVNLLAVWEDGRMCDFVRRCATLSDDFERSDENGTKIRRPRSRDFGANIKGRTASDSSKIIGLIVEHCRKKSIF